MSDTDSRGVNLGDANLDRDPETGETPAEWVYVEALDGEIKAREVDRHGTTLLFGALEAIDTGENYEAEKVATLFRKFLDEPQPAAFDGFPYDEWTEEAVDDLKGQYYLGFITGIADRSGFAEMAEDALDDEGEGK